MNRLYGIDYWIIKKKFIRERLYLFLRKLFRTPFKEIHAMTKEKLRAKIVELEFEIKYRNHAIRNLQKDLASSNEKYEALQQSICDLVEKANVDIVKKRVCVPKNNCW